MTTAQNTNVAPTVNRFPKTMRNTGHLAFASCALFPSYGKFGRKCTPIKAAGAPAARLRFSNLRQAGIMHAGMGRQSLLSLIRLLWDIILKLDLILFRKE
jgi:hypothetical protein